MVSTLTCLQDNFYYKGNYRIQSRRTYISSSIEGIWYQDANGFTSCIVNELLASSPLWRKLEKVSLKGALINYRSGLFDSEEDILIKSQFFIPDCDTPDMPFDFVDINKSAALWNRRSPILLNIFDKQYPTICKLIGSLSSAVFNEYLVHEAGHLLGYDVRSKYRDGYFKVIGHTAWPLIFLEEFRADLHSFHFAKQLNTNIGVSVFLYNILLRIGVDLESKFLGRDGYGTVPYLLIATLIKEGILYFTLDGGLQFQSLEIDFLTRAIDRLNELANHLTICFMSDNSIEGKIKAVKYYNFYLSDNNIINAYRQIIAISESK